MTDIKISPVPIHEICRPISRDEFSPALSEDVIFYRNEQRRSRPFSRLLIDDQVSNLNLVRPPGRDRTFIAHLHDALLIHDVMCVIASQDRALPPDTWTDYAMFHAVERYGNRPTPRAAFPATWTEKALYNEMEYYISKSSMLHTSMINGPQEEIRWVNYVKGQAQGVPHLVLHQPHILLSNTPSQGYFNFIMDILPRLWIFEEWPELRQLPIITPPLGAALEQLLVDLIGVPRDQLLVLSPTVHARFTFQHLIIPSPLDDRLLTVERLAFVRKLITGQPTPPTGAPRRRLYLSRRDRPYKTVANEAEIEAALAPYGFESVLGSELTVPELARLFGEAEMVVGAGGGGFANMMFMPPGAMALELSQIVPPALGGRRQIVMELANLCQLHHLVLTSRRDIHAFPRVVIEPVPECPTSMIYDPGRVAQAVGSGLAMLQRQAALWAASAASA